MNSRRSKNILVVGALVVVMSAMLGLVAYSPTLYRLFCVAFGAGGTTQRADSGSASASTEIITVRFDTNTAPGLPWRFKPVQREIKVRLGEDALVYFRAENLSDAPIVGHATFNVTPEKSGIYFKKIQCFCFNDEQLGAHQTVDMPVDFFVDPAIAEDFTTQDVHTITLSYTFFDAKKGSDAANNAQDLSRFVASAVPDAARGQELFAQRCAACHAMDRDMAGPMLGGVFGRKAGNLSSYKYSPALHSANVSWTRDNLDRWLLAPTNFIPGSRMPIRVLDPTTRRDVLAYLERESRLASEARISTAQHSP